MATYDREKDIQNLMKQDPELTRAQAEAQVDRNLNLNKSLSAGISPIKFNGNLAGVLQNVSINSLATEGDNAKIAREAVEGSKIGLSIGQTAGGFQSLTVTTDEGETVTVEPTVAMMTESVNGGGIKVTKTSGNKTEITTLTGKATKDGFLTATVTQGSPKGMLEALKATVKVDEKLLKVKVQEASTNPTVAATSVGTDVSSNVVNKVKETNKKLNIQIANPFAAFNKGADLTGAAGNPFANLLGNMAGIASKVLDKVSTGGTSSISTIATEIKSQFPDLPGDQNTRQFKELGTNFQGKFPYEVPIVKSDGSTNVSQVISESTVTSKDVKPSDPPIEVGNTNSLWKGISTNADDFSKLFTIVNTAEELEAEMRSAAVDRPITAILVGSTRQPKGSLRDAYREHYLVSKYWFKTYRREAWWDTYVGAPAHYYIYGDGSIQRGRPVKIRMRYFETDWKNYSHRTIYVKFCGGMNVEGDTFSFPGGKDRDKYIDGTAYTAAQWKSFELICKTFRKVIPGGEALSQDEALKSVSAGFSAIDWTKSRFGWETLYVGENDLNSRYENKLGPFQPEELTKYLPAKIAKPTITPVETKAVPPPKPAKVADPVTGKPPEKTTEEELDDEAKLRKIEAKIDALYGQLKAIQSEIDKLEDNAENAARLDALGEKYNATDDKILELQGEGEELRTRLYPATYKKKEIVKLEKDLATAKSRLDVAQSFLGAQVDPTKSPRIQSLQRKNIARAPENIKKYTAEIQDLENKLKVANDEYQEALKQQGQR